MIELDFGVGQKIRHRLLALLGIRLHAKPPTLSDSDTDFTTQALTQYTILLASPLIPNSLH